MARRFERRASGTEVYFKLATWDARFFTWRDGKVGFETEGDAYASVGAKKGRYRVSRVGPEGRTDLIPFEV